MAKHYLNEAGTDLLLDTGVDISDTITQWILYRKPGGTVAGSWVGAIYSSYSKEVGAAATSFIKYTLTAADFDTAGEWRFQAYIVSTGASGGTWWGETVKENIMDELQ